MSRFNLRKKRKPSSLSLVSIENNQDIGSSTTRCNGLLHESPYKSPMSSLDFLSRSLRKRRKLSSKDEDRFSLYSFNVDDLSHKEPSSKRVKTIRKSVVSLANLISPGKPSKGSNKLQRSSSFKESGSSTSSNTATVTSFKPYRPPSNTPNKVNNRRSKLWCETFDHTGLSEKQIRWQEAIFELYQGERDLVQDLTMAQQTYRDSMVTLKMLTEEEVTLIFGKLGCLLPLHEDLLNELEQARGEDGRTLGIGHIFVEWFPRISMAYRDYCANQSDAKYALDAAIERDARVRDFLQRCLESPFSRKLDLWSYLDLPRTRLVKYPLLLNNVLKRTPHDMGGERSNLEKVMEIIGEIIERVDETTGEQQCRYIRSKLEYLDDKQRSPFVEKSRHMLCSGQLKNNRGTKLHVFLFEEALVLTRQATRNNKVSYQVYRHPLPLRSLLLDSSEGDKLSGSFRGGILSSEKAKHSFRVRSDELNVSYTLQASEEHDRKQWLNAIQDALTKHREKNPDSYQTKDNENQWRRRATYDPVQSAQSKKHAARAVLRSSSDKSNRSATTNSSLQEESQKSEDSTSEEASTWRRERSQTFNPSTLLSPNIPHSKKASTSQGGKKVPKSKTKETEEHQRRQNKQVERLQLESDADGPPSPLHQGFKKTSSISRHFSLSGADKAKPTVGSSAEGRRGNPCRRSRSLTSSPQTIKAVVSRFGSKRFTHAKLGTSASSSGCSSAKPPIAPSASPYNLRRSPSLQMSRTMQEAQSTPNLIAFLRGSSGRSSFNRDLCKNNSKSVEVLDCAYGGSAEQLQYPEEESRCDVGSQKTSSNISEGDPTEPLNKVVVSEEQLSNLGSSVNPEDAVLYENKSSTQETIFPDAQESNTLLSTYTVDENKGKFDDQTASTLDKMLTLPDSRTGRSRSLPVPSSYDEDTCDELMKNNDVQNPATVLTDTDCAHEILPTLNPVENDLPTTHSAHKENEECKNDEMEVDQLPRDEEVISDDQQLEEEVLSSSQDEPSPITNECVVECCDSSTSEASSEKEVCEQILSDDDNNNIHQLESENMQLDTDTCTGEQVPSEKKYDASTEANAVCDITSEHGIAKCNAQPIV